MTMQEKIKAQLTRAADLVKHGQWARLAQQPTWGVSDDCMQDDATLAPKLAELTQLKAYGLLASGSDDIVLGCSW